MEYFTQFHLDKEKDISVTLYRASGHMRYVLRTPNYKTGNLITNLARLCGLPLSKDEKGLKIIEGTVPSYYDAACHLLYRFRLGKLDAASIDENGQVTILAAIPAISKTLMSQTKEYRLSFEKTIVRTAIPSECKFRTDLHTHMNANLTPDQLIALGIKHQIQYPYYYVRKLGLRLSETQRRRLQKQRALTARRYAGENLTGKERMRKIDDHTFINFADLILHNPAAAADNLAKIRVSVAILKDGQAVFTNLEKVYTYRYVFAKGVPSGRKISLRRVENIPDADVGAILLQMLADRQNPAYADNTLFQDKLLWTARNYARHGIRYVEISDTTLVKPDAAIGMLRQIHAVMPAIYAETAVRMRFLAALRRIPLTGRMDAEQTQDTTDANLRVLQAIAGDPYVAGSDIVGEEINDIRTLKHEIAALTHIAAAHSGFVLRIHAGENDSLRSNVENAIACVQESLAPGQPMPCLRIGHGLYTPGLHSKAGQKLLARIRADHVTLEFQITSNVRLNNLSTLQSHPLKQYLKEGVACVQGTDGGAIYGTDSIDEQLALENLLNLHVEEQLLMCRAERTCMEHGERVFRIREKKLRRILKTKTLEEYYTERLLQPLSFSLRHPEEENRREAADALKERIQEIPYDRKPIVVCGGSFNSAHRFTHLHKMECTIIDQLLAKADPSAVVFVIGHKLTGYERYLLEQNRGRFAIYAFVPKYLPVRQIARLKAGGVHIRIGIEASEMGLYKSVAFEVFKHRNSILLAFDGNASGENLIQEARNAKYDTRIFVDARAKSLRIKAQSLQGYITLFDDETVVPNILKYSRCP